MGAPRSAGTTDVREQLSVLGGHGEVVLLDRERAQDPLYEGRALGSSGVVGELDANEKLGGSDGGDRDVVGVSNETVEIAG